MKYKKYPKIIKSVKFFINNFYVSLHELYFKKEDFI